MPFLKRISKKLDIPINKISSLNPEEILASINSPVINQSPIEPNILISEIPENIYYLENQNNPENSNPHLDQTISQKDKCVNKIDLKSCVSAFSEGNECLKDIRDNQIHYEDGPKS